MDDRAVSRRGALRYLGLLAASAAGRQFLTVWLPSPATHATGRNGLVTFEGMSHPPEVECPAPYAPQFFKPGEFKTVELLTEMIIPTDDKPGAKEARVASYIDFVVFSAREFEPSLQREWMDALAFLDRESQRQFGKAFRNGLNGTAGRFADRHEFARTRFGSASRGFQAAEWYLSGRRQIAVFAHSMRGLGSNYGSATWRPARTPLQ